MSQFVLFITITLKPGSETAFLPIIKENAAASVTQESGCQQFDVLVPTEIDETTIYLYEVYDNEAAFAEHQTMPHYKKFKSETADMIDEMKVVKMNTVNSA